MRTPIKGPRFRPDRCDYEYGPRAYSHALAAIHDQAADASPVMPDFGLDIASGRHGGHPDAMAAGDVASREAVEMAGEIGVFSRVTMIKPGWLVRVEALNRCEG